MNRLAPLVVRRSGTAAFAAAMPTRRSGFERAAEARPSSDELRNFATTFLAGLVFFGTYIA